MKKAGLKGQPTKYKPEYCQMLIDHMAEGLSFKAFAGVIGVCEDTLYEWLKVQPRFSESKKEAVSKCLLWWERQGNAGLWEETEYDDKGKPKKSKKLNAAIWIYNMKCRFKEDWLDVQKSEDEVKTQKLIIKMADDDE